VLSLKLSALRIVTRREVTAESQENAGTVQTSANGVKIRSVLTYLALLVQAYMFTLAYLYICEHIIHDFSMHHSCCVS
jgi:hypothetical protein